MDNIKNENTRQPDANGLVWYRPHEAPFKLSGFHWFDQDHVYRRLPLKPPKPLPPAIERLAWVCAGGQIKFVSDTDRVALRVRLREPFGMDGVPLPSPYGSDLSADVMASGFDLYLGPPGAQAFHAVTRFSAGATEYECVLLDRANRDPLALTLNFPLMNGVEELWIGVRQAASLQEPPPYRSDSPVVVYGTSIVQGGCASRPGTCYVNILSRRLNLPFINLGFSGSGRGEPEVAQAVALVGSAALFVLDYEANAGVQGVVQTMPAFISVLRARHPLTPILVVSRIPFALEALESESAWRLSREQGRDYQRALVRKLGAAGDKHIHFLDGSRLLGEDYHECTVDGTHPTDQGFFRIADIMGSVLAKLLFGVKQGGSQKKVSGLGVRVSGLGSRIGIALPSPDTRHPKPEPRH